MNNILLKRFTNPSCYCSLIRVERQDMYLTHYALALSLVRVVFFLLSLYVEDTINYSCSRIDLRLS